MKTSIILILLIFASGATALSLQAESAETRHIKVRVNVPNAAVRARQSYVLRPSRTGVN